MTHEEELQLQEEDEADLRAAIDALQEVEELWGTVEYMRDILTQAKKFINDAKYSLNTQHSLYGGCSCRHCAAYCEAIMVAAISLNKQPEDKS